MVSIGGVGGSGTRVVAQILKELGYFIGNDLNESNDTLLFTLLFKRENILLCNDDEFNLCWNIFKKIMSTKAPLDKKELKYLNDLASKDRTLHPKEWLEKRLNFLDQRRDVEKWAWKEPNTHIVIERLLNNNKELKFIYVYRNGLDMSFSSNQNQLKLWGDIFFNEKNIEINPQNSLKYWCKIHKRMDSLYQTYHDRILMLDFDNLCTNKKNSLEGILNFLNISNMEINQLLDLIKVPGSLGRYKQENLKKFYDEDITYLKSMYGNLGLN